MSGKMIRMVDSTGLNWEWVDLPKDAGKAWFPIESIPVDGTRVLVYVHELRYNTENPTIIARYIGGAWEYEGGWKFVDGPEKWMPLPIPPQ